MDRARKGLILRFFLLGTYALLLLSITLALVWARRASARQFGTAQAKEEWQVWRGQVQQQQADRGPVARDTPRSLLPPALVLLRDYFGSCLVTALAVSSALYWTLALMTVGVLSHRSSSGERASQR